MKKIIALLLALVAIFSLVSCTTDENGGTTDGSATLDDYIAAISATAPKSMKIETTYENAAPKATLSGVYDVVFNVDGTATITGSYEKLNEVTASEFKSSVPVSVEISAAGKVSGSVDANVTAMAVNKLNLDASKITYSISMGTLDASIKAENTASVLGIDLGSDAKALISMTADGKIGSLAISYTTADGNASIVCMYN